MMRKNSDADSVFGKSDFPKGLSTLAHRDFLVAIAGILSMILLSGCADTGARRFSVHKKTIEEERSEKDLAFKLGSDSPIPPADKSRFQKLSYYRVDPQLSFHVPLNRYANPQRIMLGTNTGEIRAGFRYGYVDFQIDGRALRLNAYRLEDMASSDGQIHLLLPFRDSTSGRETYVSGRYLDLIEDESGACDLDFNRAYNPSCAYGLSFSCPVPPTDNTLPIPIRAGEKKYNSNNGYAAEEESHS